MPEVVVELVFFNRLIEIELQDRHRHIGCWNSDRVSGELTFKLGQCFRHGFGRSGFSDDHVECGCSTTAIAIVEVVDQVLIVGVTVNRLYVPILYAVFLINGGKNWRNRIGGATGG